MASKQQFIDLERRFRRVSRDAAPEPEVRSRWFPAPTIAWSDLLSKPCAVVFGEAGAGKTSEFRRVTEALRNEGKAAFFLPVEAVGESGVEKALDIAAARALRKWREEAGTEGWFLLDSVDESKLRGRPLSTALNALSHELEQHLHRIHLVLSSRASDWRSSDEELVVNLRPHLVGDVDEGDAFLFCLAPLSEAQVAKLAQHNGLSMPEVVEFLQHVREANAWVFLERPLDVASMVRYWRTHRRFGTHREMVSTDIDERLAERSDRPGLLSRERARQGARMLALAAILTQRSTFQLPDEPIDSKAGQPIVPSEVLRGWNNEDIRALLSRGLFDEATYGRVRIHHRQATEFLAAEELLALITAGLPRDDLNALLFRDSSDLLVVPAHLQPVVAWCSLDDHDVRQMAVAVIPEHLLDQADPSGLPADARRAALLAYVDQFGNQERAFHGFDPFGLKRFACPQLVATIRDVIEAPSASEHLQKLLLEIVEYGGLHELSALALEFALADKTTPRARIAAIEAVAKAGTEPERQSLLGLIELPAIAQKDVAATLLECLFPAYMPDASLHALIKVAPRPPPHRSDRLEYFLSHELVGLCSPAQRMDLVGVLAREMSAYTQGQRHVRKDRFWLVDFLAGLMTSEVSNPALPTVVRDDALWVLETCLDDPDYYAEHQLEALCKGDGLREAYFWKRAEAKAIKDGRFPRVPWSVDLPYRISLRREDKAWLRKASLERSHVQERLLAFHALAEVSLPEAGVDDAFWTVMRNVARESDELHGGEALQTRLARLQAATPGPPLDWQARNRRRDQVRQRRLKRSHDKAHAQLRANIDGIRRGSTGLPYLFEVCPRDGSTTRSARVSIDALAKLYDSEIAEAARLGFVAYWRNTVPVHVEDHPERTIPGSSLLGLVGLALDEEGGTDISALDDALLRRAIGYAPWEMNGFPPWLERCAERHPDVVRDIFAPALRQDFSLLAGTEDNLGHVLWKLADERIAIRRACAPVLAAALIENDPPRVSTLRNVLATLKDTEALPEDALLDLAGERAPSSERDENRFAMWWGVLVSRRTTDATALLAAVVARASEPARVVEAVLMRLFHHYDAHTGEGLEALRQDVVALGSLYEIAVQHVRPDDDLVHEEAYSPTSRDDAQDMRNRLLTWLAAVRHESATVELQRLSRIDGLGRREREWVLHLMRAHAVSDVSKPMSLPEPTP